MIRVVIDGYNAIFGCEKLSEIELSSDLKAARLALCETVTALTRSDEVLVVFDGVSGTGLPKRTRISSVQVVFSSSQYTADEEMLDILRHHKTPRDVTVVTSDSELSSKARELGAKVIKPDEFFAAAAKAKRTEPEPPEPRVKFDGPGPEELKYWMRIFGCKEDG